MSGVADRSSRQEERAERERAASTAEILDDLQEPLAATRTRPLKKESTNHSCRHAYTFTSGHVSTSMYI